MKKSWGIAFGVWVAAGSAGACEAGRGLKAIMTETGRITKILSAQLSDAEKNSDSIAKTERLLALADESLPACVEKLEEMTDAEAKRDAYLGYQKAISDLRALENELLASLVKNDNASAAATMTKMKVLQRMSHPIYRKPEN